MKLIPVPQLIYMYHNSNSYPLQYSPQYTNAVLFSTGLRHRAYQSPPAVFLYCINWLKRCYFKHTFHFKENLKKSLGTKSGKYEGCSQNYFTGNNMLTDTLFKWNMKPFFYTSDWYVWSLSLSALSKLRYNNDGFLWCLKNTQWVGF